MTKALAAFACLVGCAALLVALTATAAARAQQVEVDALRADIAALQKTLEDEKLQIGFAQGVAHKALREALEAQSQIVETRFLIGRAR